MCGKEIIIISRNFPPMGGVGTRRWSKFSKYLADRGYIVNIITIDFRFNDTINWTRDVVHENIQIHRLKSSYPTFLLKHDYGNFFMKKIAEIFKLFLKQTTNWLDNAQGWEKKLIIYTSKLIQKNSIKNIIVTGAPFSVLYAASFIKIENPFVNLIFDYRDSWNDERYFMMESGNIGFRRKEKSVLMEYLALSRADNVIFNTNDTRKRYESLYSQFKTKFSTLHNGFDSDDIVKKVESKSNVLRIIYTGSLLSGRQCGLNRIAQAINEMKDPFFEQYFRIDIFGKVPVGYKSPNPKIINFKGLLPSAEIMERMNIYSAALSINSEFHTFAFGSKVFDYMGYSKRILHISNGGELSELLINKGQYVATYEIESIKNALVNLKNDFLSNKSTCQDYFEFDLKNLTSKLESYFI